MKRTVTTLESCQGEFEDVLFSNDLVVVQKNWSDEFSYTRVVYVYENVGDQEPIYGIFCEINLHGTDYWKEVYNAE